MARESRIETALTSAVEGLGGACDKHVNTGFRGDPDRLVSFQWGYHCLVETKWATGVAPEAHQLRRHVYWRARGLDVWVACDELDIQRIIDFALRTQAVSTNRNTFPVGSSTWDVGSRPRIGEDEHHLQRSRHAKNRRKPILSGLGPGTKESR